MLIRKAAVFFLFFAAFSSFILNAAPEPRAVVSAASFESSLAPGSLITIFGTGLSDTQASAELDADGRLPESLGGVGVMIGGRPAGLVFASPLQLNLFVPEDLASGSALIEVTFDGESGSLEAVFQDVAPGLFLIPCLRNDRGAVLNGVTFQLEPFAAETTENGGDDKRTRLSFFGTGVRRAGSVKVELVDRTGRTVTLDAEYAGPAPGFFGLDQINVALPLHMSAAGFVEARLRVGTMTSNQVSIVVGQDSQIEHSSASDLRLDTVAGNGLSGYSGDGGPALEASFALPYAAAFDPWGVLYVADPDAHVVRKVAADGTITTFAGDGQPGNQGDSGPAVEASLQRPVALAVSPTGDVFIADVDDHRVRRVDASGVIHAFAGSGAPGDDGYGGPALAASLQAPVGLAVNRYGSVLIADRGTNRVLKVYADGSIASTAGIGAARYAGDGGPAAAAALEEPTAVAVGLDGSVYIAEGGRIRMIEPHGTIRTLVGETENALAGAALKGTVFGQALSLAADASGHLCVADTENNRISIVDAQCVISSMVGVGRAGFSPDGVLALEAQVNAPAGVVVSPAGELHFADSENRLVRKVTHESPEQPDASCTAGLELFLESAVVVSGERVIGYVRIPCPAAEAVQVMLTSDNPAIILPPFVTIPEGGTTATFEVDTKGVTDEVITVEVTGRTPDGEDDGNLTIVPPSGPGVISLSIDAESVVGGNPVEAIVRLGAPAGPGGEFVSLSVNKSDAVPPAGVTAPEGMLAVEFLIGTKAVDEIVEVTVKGEAEGTSGTDLFRILPGDGDGDPGDGSDPVLATISGLSLDPPSVVGGDPSTGTVTLSQPAPAGGVLVNLSSGAPEAQTPASIVVPQGESTGVFTVSTSFVEADAQAKITATSANSVNKTLTITPGSNPGDPDPVTAAISSLTLDPSSVVGGNPSTGTVTLAQPAPEGGVLVNLSSGAPEAQTPSSLVIPEGESTGVFTISTSVVEADIQAKITATSANSVNKTLAIKPESVPAEDPCVDRVEVSLSSILGGRSLTGFVYLTAAAGPGGIDVDLDSSLGPLSVPGSVHIAEGETSASFAIETDPVSSLVSGVITASLSGCSSKTVTVTILSPCVKSLKLSVGSIVGGGSLTGTVTLTGPAPAGGTEVELISSDAKVSVPSSVTVPEGQTSATFMVTTQSVLAILTATIDAVLGDCPGVSVELEVGILGGLLP